jgi:hypothetical protein
MLKCGRRNMNGFPAIDPKDAHPISALPLYVHEYRRIVAQLKNPEIKKVRTRARTSLPFSHVRCAFEYSPQRCRAIGEIM